jgi:hypothetical protein
MTGMFKEIIPPVSKSLFLFSFSLNPFTPSRPNRMRLAVPRTRIIGKLTSAKKSEFVKKNKQEVLSQKGMRQNLLLDFFLLVHQSP